MKYVESIGCLGNPGCLQRAYEYSCSQGSLVWDWDILDQLLFKRRGRKEPSPKEKLFKCSGKAARNYLFARFSFSNSWF